MGGYDGAVEMRLGTGYSIFNYEVIVLVVISGELHHLI